MVVDVGRCVGERDGLGSEKLTPAALGLSATR